MTTSTTTKRPIATHDDQGVTFVELFFDLVFVFSVTQVVGILHHGLSWTSIGQAVLVFWLVWWAWTQFTWALNSADTTHHQVELGTLVATAVAFLKLHARGLEHAGIVFVRQQTPVGYIVRGLVLIHQLLSTEEMKGQVEFL